MSPECCRERGPAIGETTHPTLMNRRAGSGFARIARRALSRDDGPVKKRIGAASRWRAPRLQGQPGPWSSGALRRGREDRLAGGVAAGLAARTGIDVTVVRIVFVVAALLGGFG